MRAVRAAAGYIQTDKTTELRDDLKLGSSGAYIMALATWVASVATVFFSTSLGSLFLGCAGILLSSDTMSFCKKVSKIADDPSNFVGFRLKLVDILKPAFDKTFVLRAFYPLVSKLAG